jgi:CheY-like chemotaxis protein
MPSQKKILVIEDGAVIREAMRMILQWEGYGVDCAANGQEALDYLRRVGPPDLILLDLTMPVLDGREFLRAKQNNPQLASIPVLVVTASAEPTPVGAVGSVRKPFQPEELLEAVQHLGLGPPTSSQKMSR